MAIVEDHKISNQMIVLDNLQLIVADIFGDGLHRKHSDINKGGFCSWFLAQATSFSFSCLILLILFKSVLCIDIKGL